MGDLKTILLVDDDPAIHHALEAFLADPQRCIESVYDGSQALSLIQGKRFDLVIADVHMPGMNGLDLAGQIRQLSPATRVIVMTADNTPEHVVRSFREQAFSYFSKPLQPAAVAEMVSKALCESPLSDDIEVLSARPEWISLRVRCAASVADRLLQFFRELEVELSTNQREDIAAAFREMLLNAIEHGGRNDPCQQVEVACLHTSRAIIYHIKDPGEGFSLERLPHAAVSNPPDAPADHMQYRLEHGLRPGGFGILLVRQLVDELVYNEKGNEVLMIKYLRREGA